MAGKFSDYINYRENKAPVVSKVKLSKTPGEEEFQPFVIDKDNHANLRSIIKAFENSPQVGVGYTTFDKSKGEVEPKLKKKTVYLAGGSVRDHLKGKTPKDYHLSSDATMSEIRMILLNAGFEENEESSSNKYFYVSKEGKNGSEVEYTVVVNDESFYLNSLSKSLKNRNTPDEFSVGNLEDDAATRDFTINAMYIPLKNSEGDNTELIDIYGGAHHLKNGHVVSIGSFSKNVKEDPLLAHRYIRMQSRYGTGEPPETFNKAARGITNLDPDYRKEYLQGLECPDIDKSKYLRMYSNSGLLNTIYPIDNLSVDDIPEKALGDRFLTSAWMLKDSDSDRTKEALMSAGWDRQEVNDILFLIKSYQSLKNRYEPSGGGGFQDSMCGLPSYKIAKWKSLF